MQNRFNRAGSKDDYTPAVATPRNTSDDVSTPRQDEGKADTSARRHLKERQFSVEGHEVSDSTSWSVASQDFLWVSSVNVCSGNIQRRALPHPNKQDSTTPPTAGDKSSGDQVTGLR